MKKPFIFFGTLTLAALIFFWVYLPTLSKYHDLKLQQEELDDQIAKLSKDVQDMREERDLLKNDVEYLEKVIRDELGLVKPGEIVYKFVPDEASPSPEPSPSASASPAAAKPKPSASPSPKPAISVKAKPVASPKPKPKPVLKKTAVAAKKPTPKPVSKDVYPRKETR